MGLNCNNSANISGENIADTWNGFKFRKIDGTVDSDATIPMNFKVYWDGDLLSELLGRYNRIKI